MTFNLNNYSFITIISVKKNIFCVGLFFILINCSTVSIPFKTAAVFSNHMVLQQLSDVPIWGNGTPGASLKISTSWGESKSTIIDQDGKWITTLKTPVYGGPYEMEIKSVSDQIKFKDILIGEVWLTSGQSNMEWPMRARILNQEQEIKNSNYPNIRMFSVPKNLNGTNINSASWKTASPFNVLEFSAVGYFFAREVYEKLGVPVGILNSSWGGTRIESWTSIEKLSKLTASSAKAKEIISKGGILQIIQNKARTKKSFVEGDPNFYSILYNTMIKPILPYKVKGFLWYQGESNVKNYDQYQNLFTGMISDWREKWKEELPFYFVQIAPFLYSDIQNDCGTCLSYELRDAQRKSLDLKKTGMVVTSDIAEENDIHPANKQDVGKRLARLAFANDYGMSEVLSSGPFYAEKKVFESYIDLYFDFKGSGLMAKGKLRDFEIAASDREFYPANASIIRGKVRVSSKEVINPKFVRYGWKNYFEASLFNIEGLPASSFQTP